MSNLSTNALKQIFYDAYGGFSDKRIKNLDKSDLFIVDDRSQGDKDARGNLYPWFCLIFVQVVNGDTVKVIMRGNVPKSEEVKQWLAAHNAKVGEAETKFEVRQGQEEQLQDLAAAMEAIVKPGASYNVKSYKYVCPRTARSLRKLNSILRKAWSIEHE